MACLNLVGGAIYAARVGISIRNRQWSLMLDRFLKSCFHKPLIFLEVATRFFTSWSFSLGWPIWLDCFKAFNYVHTYEDLAPQTSNIVVAAYPQNLVKTPSLTRWTINDCFAVKYIVSQGGLDRVESVEHQCLHPIARSNASPLVCADTSPAGLRW